MSSVEGRLGIRMYRNVVDANPSANACISKPGTMVRVLNVIQGLNQSDGQPLAACVAEL